jgi:tape measure domain-containing protein
MAKNHKIAELFANLSLNMDSYKKSMQRVRRVTRVTASKLNKEFRQNVGMAIKETEDDMKRFSIRSSRYIKDVSRVVTGILISQAFYSLLRRIRSATREIVEFSMEVERAMVSFTVLLGSVEKATGFMYALEEFTARTPFQMRESILAAQQLLAMGYPIQSIIPVLRQLLDAAAILGGSKDVLNRIVLAMGKIQATGIVSARELRSLAKAGIPIYQIMKEQLNLTDEQIAKIGDLRISAEQGIAAILRGLNRVKGASILISRTLPGLLSTVKDNLLLIGKDLTRGIYNNVKSFVKSLVGYLDVFRKIIRENGLGALLKELLPKTMYKEIVRIANAFNLLWRSAKKMVVVYKDIFKSITKLAIKISSFLLPVFATLIDKITSLYYWVNKNIPVLKDLVALFFSLMIAGNVATLVKGLAKALMILNVATYVTKAIRGLTWAIKGLFLVMSSHPIGFAIAAAVTLFGVFVSRIKEVRIAISKLKKSLADFAGFDPHILKPIGKQDVDTTGEYNKKYEDTVKITDKVGQAAKKASKEVKSFLANFDEVVTIPDKKSSGIEEAFNEMSDVDTKIPNIDLQGLNLEELTLPTLTKIYNTFTGNLKEFIKNIIGAIKNGYNKAIKFIKGLGPETLKNLNNWKDTTLRSVTDFIARIIAKILLFNEDSIKTFTEWYHNLLNTLNKFGSFAWSTLKEAFKRLKNIFTDWSYESLTSWIEWCFSMLGEFRSLFGELVKVASDGVIRILGHILGFSDDTVQAIIDWKDNIINVFVDWSNETLKSFSKFITGTMKFFKDWRTKTIVEIYGWYKDALSGFNTWFLQTLAIFTTWDNKVIEKIQTWIADVKAKFEEWKSNTLQIILSWSNDFDTAVAAVIDNTILGIIQWKDNMIANFQLWLLNTKMIFIDFVTNTIQFFQNWREITIGQLISWSKSTMKTLSNWVINTLTTFLIWDTDIRSLIQGWIDNIKAKFNSWKDNTITTFKEWDAKIENIIINFIDNTIASINQWIVDVVNGIINWKDNVINVFVMWKIDLIELINNTVNRAYSIIIDTLNNIKDRVSISLTDMYTTVVDAFDKINEYITTAGDTMKTIFDNIWESIKIAAKKAWKSIFESISGFIDSMIEKIGDLLENIAEAGEKVNEFFTSKGSSGGGGSGTSNAGGYQAAAVASGVVSSDWSSPSPPPNFGLAKGGIVRKQIFTRLAEKQKEAVIPLSESGLRPLANALLDVMGHSINSATQTVVDKRPLYVGTLIADERGLKQLNRKLRVIELQEKQRRGDA